MDFGALPPEINSARMYAGAGPESMLVAAATWDELADEVESAAESYRSVISALVSGPWTGPSAASMAGAAAPYAVWLSQTAAQAHEAAIQATAAAEAYATAFAATVAPSVVAANRSLLAALLATNILGQNAAAIAATEADYAHMWAQDAAAMYTYAAASAAATRLTAFSAPPQTTNPAGSEAEARAAAEDAASSTGTGAQSGLSGGPLDWLSQLLQELANASTSYNTTVGKLLNSLTGSSSTTSIYQSMMGILGSFGRVNLLANDITSIPSMSFAETRAFFHPVVAVSEIAKSTLGAGLHPLSPAAGEVRAGPMSAGLGQATTLGRLSVPPSWTANGPAIRLTSAPMPQIAQPVVPAMNFGAPPVVPGAVGSATGSAIGSRHRVNGGAGKRSRAAAVAMSNTPGELGDVFSHVQEHPDAIQHWQVSSAGLDDLLANLSEKPGIHAIHIHGR
ncbi:PPE family protein [Mycobacterium intracellulare]|uniref:PPE family protein n=1 Tax=Mycobacterium intracellulare TaxID=1767 RepID=UPI0023B201C8|nr:PPE family protein [Mycobacterium intracellulare]MEE3750855.1 PPE family protein [Mycobacterium intracellulare]